MRIAYIAGSPIPSSVASSVHVVRMCSALSQVGHDVVLFSPLRPEVDRSVADPFAFYGVARSFRLCRLPWSRGRLAGYRFALRCALRLRQVRPALVYTRHLASAAVAAALGYPIVLEIHVAPRSRGLEGKLFRWLLHARRLRRIVVVSDALRQDIVTTHPRAEALVRVEHDAAADDEGTSPTLSLGAAHRLQVGYVGNLYPGKGLELIAHIARACPFADFQIVGGSDEDVGRWRSRMPANVHFHGFVPHARTAAYRRACDVLLAPYQRRVEGYGGREVSDWMSPLKLFEYMAACRPIVASELPVICEVLQDGRNALLCPPDAVPAWAEALARLAGDPALRRQLGEQAHATFLAHHTWRARASSALEGLTV